MIVKRNIPKIRQGVALVMAVVLVISGVLFADTRTAYADSRKLVTLNQAINLAYNNSSAYRKVKNKISLQQVSYTQAVKSIQLKKKSMLTFRWSPLLEFHFPEDPFLSDEYEWIYKPIQIQGKITNLRHQLDDVKYEIKEETANAYVQTYTAQEKVAYYTERLSQLKTNLQNNKARYYLGLAKKSDIDNLEKSVASTEATLVLASRNFESCKKSLSDLIGLDVTSGYRFESPYVTATISRTQLESLQTYTLDRNQSCFEARTTSSLALASMNTNYDLMRNHYGGDMGIIDPYINQVRSGNKVDSDAFKGTYDRFLDKVDSYWRGSKRILFIKIPKEWFKSDTDGVRYVEDDPYILLTDALEYQEALADQKSTEKDVKNNVEVQFENLITAYNSYLSMEQQVADLKTDYETGKVKNRLGELSLEELMDAESLYQDTQLDLLDSMDTYTQLVYSFDRLTCGGITRLLAGKSISLDASSDGDSYLDDEMQNELSYYIVKKVEDNIFELGINIPEEYDIEISDFELWVDGVQVGNRTSVDKVLRHLALSIDQADEVVIRLYNGDEFLADCPIDPMNYNGILTLPQSEYSAEDEANSERVVANFSYSMNETTHMVVVEIKPKETETMTGYKILDQQGQAMGGDNVNAITGSFQYLDFMVQDIEKLTVVFYDSEDGELYKGHFKLSDMTIVVPEE